MRDAERGETRGAGEVIARKGVAGVIPGGFAGGDGSELELQGSGGCL